MELLQADFVDSKNRFHEVDQEDEDLMRFGGCFLIRESSLLLKLPQAATASAMYFFHKFFARRPFGKSNFKIVACCCVYVATKSEEAPKKLRDVINSVFRVIHPESPPMKIDKRFWELRDALIQVEQDLIRTAGFEFSLPQPYKLLFNYLKILDAPPQLAQAALNIVNDSFFTNVCVHYQPHCIAVTSIYLAAEMLSISLPSGAMPWWELFDTTLDTLHEIGHRILDNLIKAPSHVSLHETFNSQPMFELSGAASSAT